MKFVAGALPIVAAVALAGCGGSSGSTTANGARGPGGFAALTAAQRACLKKQGVTPPSGRGRPPSGGRPPNGTVPNGAPPQGGIGGGNPQRFQKLRAAMQACGVTFAQRGQGGQGFGPPPAAGTTTQS